MPQNNTLTLMNALGWQGGTTHQVCHALETDTQDILNADGSRMAQLLDKARAVRDIINAQ